MDDDFDAQVSSVSALGEPVRRDLYRFVVAQREPVGREEAAAGVGVAHHVAKFHLDKLEHDGLLEAEYRRPPGRTGPGAGRPTKLYRRSARDISISLPERQYDLAGRVLAAAVTAAGRSGTPLDKALRTAATDTGRALASSPDQSVVEVLTGHGYEPFETDSGFALANCPFHSLARDYTELICGLNLDLVRGLLRGLGSTELRARLDPAPDRCCVTLVRSAG
jgi:predicted ArsR family transcriptional regulator